MKKVSRLFLVLALGLSAPGIYASAAGPAPIGQVLLSLGQASRLGVDGSARPLRAGEPVFAGDTLTTGDKSFVHVRMVDQALVVLRPLTRLNVPLYEFDPQRPQASKIKLELLSGNSRTVSGRGGEAAKQGYRFNTPVAAIGLRGTDYSVTATQDLTRVSVAKGAVVVTPLGNGCTSAGLGPCSSAASQELTAEQRHAYIEVSAKYRFPKLVSPEQDPVGAAGQNPSDRPAEPSAKSPPVKTGDSVTARGSEKETVNAVVVEDALASAYQLHWGRWNPSAVSSAPNVMAVLTPGREIAVGNSEFGLVRSVSALNLPSDGRFEFSLMGSDALVRTPNGTESARVLGGSFAVDFMRRGFDTQILVDHSQGTESIWASGAVNFRGFLYSNPSSSNASINGAIASTGQEAAYLFEKSLLNNRTLFGATRWIR